MGFDVYLQSIVFDCTERFEGGLFLYLCEIRGAEICYTFLNLGFQFSDSCGRKVDMGKNQILDHPI